MRAPVAGAMSHPSSSSLAGSAVRTPHKDGRPAAVEAHGLVKRFGRRCAVNGVQFAIAEGECLSVFGPNGAGKTTLLRLLAGLLTPTSGSAHIAGVALPGVAAARARLGLVTHATLLYRAGLAEGLALGTHVAVMREGIFVRHEPRSGLDPERYAAEYRELLASGS